MDLSQITDAEVWVAKIKTSLDEGNPKQKIMEWLVQKENYSEVHAKELLVAGAEALSEYRRKELKDRLECARKELKNNDDGIDAALVKALEDRIREMLAPEDLESFNRDLAAKGRRLTYHEIALIGAIHRRSIRENKGASPFTRIQKLAARSGLTDLPLDNRQIRYALAILEALGFTKQYGSATRGTVKDGKYQKGQCGRWDWNGD